MPHCPKAVSKYQVFVDDVNDALQRVKSTKIYNPFGVTPHLVVCSQRISKPKLNKKSRRLQDHIGGPGRQRCEETVRIKHDIKVLTTSREVSEDIEGGIVFVSNRNCFISC